MTISNNDTIFETKAKADEFNNAFLSYLKLDTTTASIPNTNNRKTRETLSDINVSEQEILDILLNLDTSKATGPDMISSKMLRETAHSITPSLTRLIRASLSTKCVPQGWKEANVIPLHKKGNKSIFNNYRPISLLNITAKIYEKVIFKHLFNYIRENNLITLHQSGCVPGDSTINQLVYLYNIFAKALNDKKDVRTVFCDQTKAFDRVWHEGLLHKLETFGITGNLFLWLKSYLSDRRQRVVIRNECSSWGSITAGVHQGSVLGPLLFLININDIVDNIESDI